MDEPEWWQNFRLILSVPSLLQTFAGRNSNHAEPFSV